MLYPGECNRSPSPPSLSAAPSPGRSTRPARWSSWPCSTTSSSAWRASAATRCWRRPRCKYCTNIRYLMPREQVVSGYQAFVQRFCQGEYQYQRLKTFLDNLDQGNYIPLRTKGYGSLGKYLAMVCKSPNALKLLARRLFKLASRRDAVWAVLRATLLLLARSRRHKRLLGILQFWLFAWTNSIVKYEGLTEGDFDIESVPPDFDRTLILPEHYVESAGEAIP